jgi:IS4 transposase
LLDGFRVKILDGNHLTATERRLSELRNSHAGPLPGQCLVVMDPALMLVIDAVPCEDAYKNERSLATDILKHVERNDVWIADRNFCTSGFMREIASREAFFVIRQHGALDGKELAGRQKKRGRVDTGAVFEQDINIDTQDNALWVRRITIRLEGTTRDGDNEIHILSNLPKSDADAMRIAELYRKRWRLEVLFSEITTTLCCEVKTLSHPKAALFIFCVALMAYNVLSVVKAALRAEHGDAKIEDEVSSYYIAAEVHRVYEGMMVVLSNDSWLPFGAMTHDEFANALRSVAKGVNLKRYTKSKKTKPKSSAARTRFIDRPHVSTARLLAESRRNRP